MKKKKTELLMSLSILFIYLFLIASSLNNLNTKALVDENLTHHKTDSKAHLNLLWTTTEVISTESTNHSQFPSLTIDSSDIVHVAWSDWTDYAGNGTDFDIFYKHSDSSTSSWITSEVVSTESSGSSGYPSLAVDSAGNIHITWLDLTDYFGSGTDSDIFYKKWDSTISKWTTTDVISAGSINFSYNPSLAVDSADNVHFVWADYTNYTGCGIDSDIFYKWWNASTNSWSITEVVSTESSTVSSSPSVAIDSSGDVHIAWNDYTDYAGSGGDLDIFYKRWNASSSTWTTTEVVSTESTSHSDRPSLVADSTGNIYVVWEDYTDYVSSETDTDIFYKYWNASSSSWNYTEVVSTVSTSTSTGAALAIDFASNVHFVWADYTNYTGCGTDPDIFYRWWNASTSSWGITEVISTESSSSSGYPSLAVDSISNIHVAWHDWTDYASSGTDWDIFYKFLMIYPIVPEMSFTDSNSTEFVLISNLIIATSFCLFIMVRTRKNNKLN